MDLHSFQSRVVTKDCHVKRGEVLVLYCPVECGRNYGVSGAGKRESEHLTACYNEH